MSAPFLKKYSIHILLSIGFISVVLLHATELRLRTVYPDPTYAVLKGVLANSADTDNYLSIAENFLAGNGLRLNGIEGGVSYFGRMPGYSFLYLAFRSFFDPVTALLCMKWLQIALFLVSIFCIYRTITILSDERTAGVLTLIYTLVPCFYSFTFYILTEAITGFMLVFATYTTVKAWHTAQPRNKLLLYAAASFLIGYLMLSRPVLGMYILGLAAVVFADYRRQHLSVGRLLGNLTTVGLPFAPILASWMIHIYVTTGQVVVLSKYTHPTSASLYKLPTWGLWSVGQSWGEDGVVFNTYGVPLYYGAIAGDTSDALIEPALATWKAGFPPVAELGDERLREGIKLYQRAVILQKPYVENKQAMPDEYLTEELAAYSYLTGIRDELKSRHPFVYHVKAPLTYLRMAVLNSGTSNIYMFQERFRSEQLLNVLRFGLLAFNICLYLVLFINLLTLRKTLPFIFFVVIPILYLIVLCYFVRSLEQRYMFPIYPLLLISACYPLQRFIFRNKPAPLPL